MVDVSWKIYSWKRNERIRRSKNLITAIDEQEFYMSNAVLAHLHRLVAVDIVNIRGYHGILNSFK